MTGSSVETRPRSPAAKALAAVWFTWAVLFVALGLLAVVRRLAGGYTAPPSLAALAGWSFFVAGSAGTLRWLLWRTVAAAWPSAWYYVVMGAISAALLLWNAALTIAGAPVVGLVILWALAAAEEGIAWPLLARRRRPRAADAPVEPAGADSDRRGRGAPPTDADRREDPPDCCRPRNAVEPPQGDCPSQPISDSSVGAGSTAEDGLADADDAPWTGSNAVVQQLTRMKPPAGPEMVVGWLRLPLEPGQRSGVLHAAFCPPLEGPPIIEFEQIDGPPARIKVTQAYAYGARFEVKLPQPIEEAGFVVVQFSAATSPDSRDAAAQ